MFNIVKYYLFSAIVFLNIAVVTIAQETKHDVNIDVDVSGVQWYSQWWIWGMIAMLFVVTIVALLTRSRRVS